MNCDDDYGKRIIEAVKDRPIVLKTIGHDKKR